MSLDAYLTLGILLATFVLLIKTQVPPPAVFMGALTAALALDLAPVGACLKGFANPGMIAVGVLYMVAAGMYATGAISIIVDKLMGAPKSLLSAQLKILPPIAVGSGFLNNTPLVSMMLPVLRDLCRSHRLPPSRLYMPLSFASILGGACTLIGTSTNLVIAGLVSATLASQKAPGVRELNMFDPALAGAPIMVAGLLMLIVLGPWLFPLRQEEEEVNPHRWHYLAEFEVEPGSRLEGKTLAEAGLAGQDSYCLESVSEGGGVCQLPGEDYQLQGGDLLRVSTHADQLVELWRTVGLRPHISLNPMPSKRHTHQLVKAVIAQSSLAVGRRVDELPGRDSPYQMKIVAISRGGKPVEGEINDVRIQAGDNVILEVNDSFFFINANDREFALTKPLVGFHLQHTERALFATLITAAMVAVVALGLLSMLKAALLATGLMLLTGCLSLKHAAKSIDYGTLVVIACAIGLESAVTHSGLAKQVGHLVSHLGGNSPQLALAAIFLGTTLMTNIITNNAAAAFMFPIALATAHELGVSFTPFAITLMLAASCAFITPTGYQTNLMVWGPGGYKFTDFARAGLPLTIVVGVLTVLLCPLIYGF